MISFESSVTINQPINQVYNFLSDLNNHSELMPDDVSDWASDTDNATFAIKNMAKLTINVVSRSVDSEILITSSAPSPFKIEMRWTLNAVNQETVVNLNLRAQLSPLLKIMASTALQKLVNHKTSALKSILE